MEDDSRLVPDFYFGRLEKPKARKFRELVARVVVAATAHGRGRDVFEYVYLAGLSHGSEIERNRK